MGAHELIELLGIQGDVLWNNRLSLRLGWNQEQSARANAKSTLISRAVDGSKSIGKKAGYAPSLNVELGNPGVFHDRLLVFVLGGLGLISAFTR